MPDALAGMRWTRRQFVGRAAGVGLALAGVGYGADRIVAGDGGSSGATAAPTGVHIFRSRPDLMPPIVTVERRSDAVAPGRLFLAPINATTGVPSRAQQGALIIDDAGEPIWFEPVSPLSVMNLRVAAYKGAPVLTWWEGKTVDGLGEGSHVIADASYRVLARFPAGDGRPSDLHEFLLTPQGTALVTAWEKDKIDLRRVGGPARGRVVGGIAQELDIPSARVLFEWRSLDHVPIEDAQKGSSINPFDYFHINAVGLADDGNILVSSRNTWSVYKVDRGSGEIIWRLGGKRSDFHMGPGTHFAWQHDAREHPSSHGTLMSVFDDGAAPKVQSQSRGLVLALDTKRMRATLVRSFPHTPPVLATALGSTQQLPNGNWLVGYGTGAYLTEFTPDGSVAFDAALPVDRWNYRTLRFPWIGRPTEPPAAVVTNGVDDPRLYVSWNGATEVASWQLRTGSSDSDLSVALTRPRSGFETALPVPAAARYASAVALDAAGKPIGSSAVLKV